MNSSQSNPSIGEVLQDFATGDVSDPRLADFVRRFPGYEAELRAFAAEAAALMREAQPETVAVDDLAIVRRTLPRLTGLHNELTASRARDVFEGLAPAELRTIARRLDLPMPFMDRLKSRLVEVTTIPAAFVAWLARGFEATEEDIRFTLDKPALAGGAGAFVIDGAAGSSKQTFEEALETCPLSGEQRDRLRRVAQPPR